MCVGGGRGGAFFRFNDLTFFPVLQFVFCFIFLSLEGEYTQPSLYRQSIHRTIRYNVNLTGMKL